MYEAVQNIEYRDRPGAPPEESILGVFDDEEDAIEAGRSARQAFADAGGHDVAWWLVRRVGERVATWIADSRSPSEFVLDLRTGELVEL